MHPVPAEGTLVQIDAAEVKEGKTSPPKHYTEDTLLSAMETAGADEIPDEAERKGLGTPATRAATIEKLVQKGFIERNADLLLSVETDGRPQFTMEFENRKGGREKS